MNIKKLILSVIAVALLLGSLSACGQKSADTAAQISYSSAAFGAQSDSYEVAAAPLARNAGAASGTASIPLPDNRKWVITISLSAETEHLEDALAQLSTTIQELDGYVENQSISGNSASTNRSRYAYLTIRVPADKVDSFAQEVSGMANVVSSSRYVEDITLSYTDTEGRLTALKTEETRLLELMEQAETVGDLLDIEERLTEVRYQLENYASTLRLYDNQVDYATVELRITEVEKYTPVEEQGFWQRISDGLSDSIVGLGDAVVALISWLIIDLPYLIAIALVIWLTIVLTRRSLRRRKAKKQAKENPGTEKSE